MKNDKIHAFISFFQMFDASLHRFAMDFALKEINLMHKQIKLSDVTININLHNKPEW